MHVLPMVSVGGLTIDDAAFPSRPISDFALMGSPCRFSALLRVILNLPVAIRITWTALPITSVVASRL